MEDIIHEWQIVTGCERLTPGCKNCPTYWNYKQDGLDYHPTFHVERLTEPSFWTSGTCIVAPGSDLLHEAIRYEKVFRVAKVMKDNPQISFEMGTKRVERLEALPFTWADNVVIIVGVEESRYKWRIDSLRNIKAKLKMVSFGPITGRVGQVDLSGIDIIAVIPEIWGKDPRECKQEWIDELYEQAQDQGVAISENYWLCKENANAITK